MQKRQQRTGNFIFAPLQTTTITAFNMYSYFYGNRNTKPDAEAKSHHISKEPLSGSMLLEMLAEGPPIPFTILGIKNNEDGTATGDTLVHIINTDNFGNERYVYLNLLKQHWES